jgi:ribosomal protein S18 acetylase RimI-like enzyme
VEVPYSTAMDVIRGYETGDAVAVAQVVNAIAEHNGYPPWAVPAAVDGFVASAIGDAATDSRLVFTADGTLAAVGMVSTPSAGGSRVNLFGGVHPQWRGRGLGRELLGWQLTRAEEIHAARAPAAEWTAFATEAAADQVTARLLHRFGLAPERYWFDMTAPVPPAAAPAAPPDGPAAPPDGPAGPADGPAALPDGLRSVAYEPAYEQALHAAFMEAFAENWGFQYRELDDWTPMSVRLEAFLPELSRLALDGDEIAGFVLSQRDTEPAQFMIAEVGVRAPWRRRGVAGGLLAEVLRDAGEAGMKTARLMVDADSPTGAVGVYERAGFTVESRAATYTKRMFVQLLSP